MNTKTFEKYVKAQALLHPGMTPQDAVKLCFQAAFGAEHILSDKIKAMEYLREEYSRTPTRDIDVFEPISEEFARCNIAAWKYKGLPIEWLFEMFCQSAWVKKDKRESLFMEYLDSVGTCSEDGTLRFDSSMWSSFIEQYLFSGIKPLHHSQEYRDKEHPAYRVVDKKCSTVLPILERAIAIPTAKAPKIIVIDGRAAAGKTTIAAILSAVLRADVIHMDDFFLPPELQTAERYAQSGGNIHYERFCPEVLPFLKQSREFSYRCFDCSIMDFGGSRHVQSGTWRIVEGSYSNHPMFGNYADIRVFCDVPFEEQMQRIIKRNGEAMADVFFSKWIPMEELYFDTEQIKQKADIVIE